MFFNLGAVIDIRGGAESKESRIDFYRNFQIIFHLSNQIANFDSNWKEFQTNPISNNLTPICN